MKPKHDHGRFRALAARLEEAAAATGVAVTREEIPYGVKLTLTAGIARGVIALYTTGKIVPNPGANAHFADLVAAMTGAPVALVSRPRTEAPSSQPSAPRAPAAPASRLAPVPASRPAPTPRPHVAPLAPVAGAGSDDEDVSDDGEDEDGYAEQVPDPDCPPLPRERTKAQAPTTTRVRRPAHDAVSYPYGGSDESGKGDYFGPLTVAATVLLDAREEELLRTLGVMDSKLLVGTAPARSLAKQIREVCAGRFAEVILVPEDYNARVEALKRQGKSSNPMLAWAHLEALHPLLEKDPAVGLVVADKFGNASYLTKEMKARGHGRGIELRQETKGERYTAVAAASILARDLCLAWFERADAEVGERLPRGAFDPGIIHVARRLFAKGGIELLGKYAKLHFRTTERIAGRLPFDGR